MGGLSPRRLFMTFVSRGWQMFAIRVMPKVKFKGECSTIFVITNKLLKFSGKSTAYQALIVSRTRAKLTHMQQNAGLNEEKLNMNATPSETLCSRNRQVRIEQKRKEFKDCKAGKGFLSEEKCKS